VPGLRLKERRLPSRRYPLRSHRGAGFDIVWCSLGTACPSLRETRVTTLRFVPGGPDPMTNRFGSFRPSTVVANVGMNLKNETLDQMDLSGELRRQNFHTGREEERICIAGIAKCLTS
jgi:hypothetical protein